MIKKLRDYRNRRGNKEAIVIMRSRGKKPWRYRVVGANGEPMSASQAYPTEAHARRGARDLIRVCSSPTIQII